MSAMLLLIRKKSSYVGRYFGKTRRGVADKLDVTLTINRYSKNTDTDHPFAEMTSTGTMSLAAFYYWYIMLDDTSFAMIDGFDAYYHHELSENVVNLIKNFTGTQVFLTTHNTDLMTYDLLRPNFYFLPQNGKIDGLNNVSEVDLEKVHNLQKMYKAGFFDE